MEYRVWSRVLLCYLLLSRYQKMDITQSLRQNLSDKTVVEYPTLHVCIAQSSTSARYIVFDQSMDYGMYAVARDTLYSVRYISFTNLINGWLFIIKSFPTKLSLLYFSYYTHNQFIKFNLIKPLCYIVHPRVNL